LTPSHRKDWPGTALGPTDPASVRVAKTASRSVLGHLNEMALEVEHAIAASGGLRLADVAEVNRRLRRGLHGRDGDYVVPLELAAARSV
jgi:protein involved in polysaccharide export with SLBB domain